MGIKLTDIQLINFNQGQNPKHFRFANGGSININDLEFKWQPVKIDEMATLLLINNNTIISTIIPCVNSSIFFDVQQHILPPFRNRLIDHIDVRLTSTSVSDEVVGMFLSKNNRFVNSSMSKPTNFSLVNVAGWNMQYPLIGLIIEITATPQQMASLGLYVTYYDYSISNNVPHSHVKELTGVEPQNGVYTFQHKDYHLARRLTAIEIRAKNPINTYIGIEVKEIYI